jgi:protein ImuB
MAKRYVSIWFRHLVADRIVRRQPELKYIPFITAAPERGRMVVKVVNEVAQGKGIHIGMVVADCRAVLPGLTVLDDDPKLIERLLKALAEWCICFTPIVAIDPPDGLILDASGCAHLWGGEQAYLHDIVTKLTNFGYNVNAAIADTIGMAWAMARYGDGNSIVPPLQQMEALLSLPSAALRIEPSIVSKLDKLGLYKIKSFINMQRLALRKRFGQSLLMRIDQAIGTGVEIIEPVCPIEPYQERLPCLEPIRTATGIEIALTQLLETICTRLTKEDKGLRKCVFKCFRVDGNIQKIEIGTNKPSRNAAHLFKLFEIKISQIEPKLGIELFLIEAPIVEDLSSQQEALWSTTGNGDIVAVAELLDRFSVKLGIDVIHRYLPAEHYWPERSYKEASSIQEKATTNWRTDLPRPLQLLPEPEFITVTVPIPDYPPMQFHYKGKRHIVAKADGPERIEQEWWLQEGLYRDYYCVEDQEGARYWVFRLGDYQSGEPKWYMHGFFA